MDLLDLDATGQADLVRQGEISPLDLVRASIDAIERFDPQLDAILHRSFDYALTQAEQPVDKDAPFCGVPTVLKDLGQELTGFPYSFGAMPFLREKPFISDHDTNFAADLRKAGFSFVGRSNTPLHGVVFPTHDVEAHVMPRNPWNRDFATGGSSSGSAAAVAAHLVPIAHGNDGGGSIRLPASLCGVVGMKPTRGRISSGPDDTEILSVASAWSHEFVLTRTVRDAAGVLNATQGWRPGDSLPIQVTPIPERSDFPRRPLRIGLTTTPFMAGIASAAECNAAAEKTAQILRELGHQVELVDPPRYDLGSVRWDYGAPAGPAFAWIARSLDIIGRLIGRTITMEDVGPQLWAVAELGRSYTGPQIFEFGEVMQRCVVAFDRWWIESGIDVLLSPSVAATTPPITEYLPPPHGTFVIPDDIPLIGLAGILPFIVFTQIFNWTGQPAISLPLAEDSTGLPLGVQIAGARMCDDLVIQVAYELEEAMPWAHRRPQVCA